MMIKFCIAGDPNAAYYARDGKVAQFMDSYLGKLFYSQSFYTYSACIRGLDKTQTPPKDPYPVDNLAIQLDRFIPGYKGDYLVIGLGQFDLEFDYYYRSVIEQKNTDRFIDELVDIYRAYLQSVKEKHGIGIVIRGLNPTVLVHDLTSQYYIANQVAQFYGSGNKEADTELYLRIIRGISRMDFTYAKRFEQVRQFNEALKSLAKELGGHYFDIWDKVIDPDTGMVDFKFMPAPGTGYLADTFAMRQIHYDALYRLMQDIEADSEQ